ncbi:SDR family NAD(P)-dependent oxidoreductase [Maricurvus nonylphenolicus]|uniref:SDR family NAD(P)-dependent oxidoreductase n=1 Tax=Maricurvus nonylphenolicus TaxID=1008307 RepID=UPI0036F44E7D
MQQPVNTPFSSNTPAEEIARKSDMTGKRIIITGANSGLGKETARVLGMVGAEVVLAVRNLEAGQAVATELAELIGKNNFEVAELNLSAKDSIRKFAETYLENNDRLDVLISNAGIMGVDENYIDGLESQMAVNFLGHFLLSALLAPALKQTEGARIVTLTSVAHHISDIDFNDFNFDSTPYHPMLAYGRSKTANALLAVALHDRLASFDVTSLAVHPGIIHETGLNRSMDEEAIAMIDAAAQGGAKTTETGAATSVWAATCDDLLGKGGLYLEDCKVSELLEQANFVSGVLPFALSTESADRLWTQAESWLGERFNFT